MKKLNKKNSYIIGASVIIILIAIGVYMIYFNKNITMKGTIATYSWEKTFNNFDYANCGWGSYGNVVFKEKIKKGESPIDYAVEFKSPDRYFDENEVNNYSLKSDYSNKTIEIKGKLITKIRTLEPKVCPPMSQCPADLAAGTPRKIKCYKIIEAEIINLIESK